VHALICDDDAGTRLLVRHLVMQKLGWTVAECADGAAALQMLGRIQFDVAILDINMPQLDGINVLQAIRRSPRLRHLPVVIMTSDHREEVVRRLLALGIADFIVKPPDVQTTIAKLEKIKKSP
jgi:two-component system chemotaxis response regulator CheY